MPPIVSRRRVRSTVHARTVPQMVAVTRSALAVSRFDIPKSVNFKWPSMPTMTFSGLRSRKMMLCACTCSSARTISPA
eukprot:920491-Pleurochrysis_carterae.AAC.1